VVGGNAIDPRGQVVFKNLAAEALTRSKYKNAISKNLTEVFSIINEQIRDHPKIRVTIAVQARIVVDLVNYPTFPTKERGEVFLENSAAPIKTPKET